jgi:uncharacterized Zn finger protein
MWDWYPKSQPRRPANGIKAQSRQFGRSWWAGRWLAALYELIDSGRLQRGRSYARSGQVLNLDIQPGQVDARVQGSRPQPYKVQIKIKPLTARQWKEVTDAMSAQALFAAKLLAGEMPQQIEEAFSAANVSLFPSDANDLETDCSCPDWSNPCKHIAAVYYLLGEQFDADPFLIFRLRGKTKSEIISMLRARRAASAITAPAKPRKPKAKRKTEPPEPVIPLEALTDSFWSTNDLLDTFRVHVRAAEIDAAPVKRLGLPGFWHGRGDLGETFARTYHTITAAALALIESE